ncbi:MAG: ABC transporter ATP-binding protein, partial [Erysipelotrichaceae bacterium]
IIANPSIFVLDEATSSIDTETEQIIQHAIENLMKGKTSFVIAHRLSTIVHADRILVIRKGLIVEDGTHNSLIAKKGYYYRLYTNQFNEDLQNQLLHINEKKDA